ncbi:hypothetical protein [Streptomyces sp. MNU89]|uniref:hypothetical protein n=1 Tax=Streptomyces sp. MNU89 TaxID=2560025 RepID=UPI001E3A4E57|nr:hypothetical protein [Streptomyces sp. MNU89]MCC9740334.1 hypothetical protein [Streptomyces sp. MNU89]
MPEPLPVPIKFQLPEGWRAAPPDEVGAPGAAFVALHPHPDAGFTANITIDGEYRPDTATLQEMAHESVERVRRASTSVDVTEHREIGSADAPGLTQSLAISAVAAGVRRELIQVQVYLSMLDPGDLRKRVVVRLVLTTTASQHSAVLSDFQEFLRTVHPDTGAAS